MKKRNKKGFTLIELLAVIVILAVIAIIISPVITGLIKQAKEDADKRSAEGYVKAAEDYYAKSLLDTTLQSTYDSNIIDDLEIAPRKDQEGSATYIDNKGETAISLIINNKCYLKDFNQSVKGIVVSDDTESCFIAIVPPDSCFEYNVNDADNVTITKYLCGSASETPILNIITPTIIDNKNVTSISNWAFYNAGLTNVEITDNIISMGSNVFDGNRNLKAIKIGNGLTSIPSGTFQYCYSLENIIWGDQNKLTSIEENSFTNNKIKNLTIPDGVTHIGTNAFVSSDELESIVLPDSLKQIDNYAFQYSKKLKTLDLGNGVEKIGDSVFYSDYDSPDMDSIVIPNSVTSIGYSSFYRKNATVNDFYIGNGLPVDIISYQIFSYDATMIIKNLHFVEGITKIKDYAFSSCSIENIIFPSSMIWIGDNAFSYLGTVKSVTFGENITHIGQKAFSTNIIEEVTIPEGVTELPYSVFYRNKIKKLVLPSSLITIGDYAFYDNQIESVVIPETVKSIGYYAFSKNKLTSITIPNSVTEIGYDAFSDNQLTSITIPNSVTAIDFDTFRDNQLTSVTIPNNITTIGDGAFSNNQLTSIEIPNSVTSLGAYAFLNNQLESVIISNSVTAIDFDTFRDNQLTSVTIPNNITTIRERAFYNNQLTSVTLFNGLTSIGYGSFENNQLTSVNIPGSVTSIGNFAFDNNQLVSVSIPKNVTSIGPASFSNNATLTSLTVDNYIGIISYAPWGATNATITYRQLTFDDSITDLKIYSTSKSGNTYTAKLCSTDSTKEITSITANGTKFNGNTITFTGDTVNITAYTYEPVINIATAHNYATNLNGDVEGTSLWTSKIDGSSSVSVTFNSSSKTEADYDFIYIYDESGNQIQKLSGTEMAGKTYTITGDSVIIKLISDQYVTAYGFEAIVRKVS